MKYKISLLLNCVLFLICVVFIGERYEWSLKREKIEEPVEERMEEQREELTEEEAVEEEVEEVALTEAELLSEGRYPIMGKTDVTIEQMVEYYEQSGAGYPRESLEEGGAPDIETFCRIYVEEAEKEGVRTEVAFAQTMKETGWLQYGGDAQITQYNFAGLGTTGNGVPGNSFPNVREGVRAQIQHLKAYATEEALATECVDSRYSYVTKGCAPYVEWLGQKENPQGYGWATGENYGYDIVKMIQEMKKL